MGSPTNLFGLIDGPALFVQILEFGRFDPVEALSMFLMHVESARRINAE